jgi:uncharacterized protein YmfQ (DUF2313 family)
MRPYCTSIDDPFRCPTKYELWQQVLKMLPRGRAWQNAQSVGDTIYGDANSQVGTFEADITPLGAEPSFERLTVLQQFWLAFAEVLEYLHQRACTLLDEMFCSTVNELRIEWWQEYGFPDPCDPWNSLCAKVTAVGGSNCEYLTSLAISRGWVIACADCDPTKAARAGCAHAGCAKTCGCAANTIYVSIDLAASPSYVAPKVKAARSGAARAGSAIAAECPPNAEALQCLIERFKPAHVKAVYIFEDPAT